MSSSILPGRDFCGLALVGIVRGGLRLFLVRCNGFRSRWFAPVSVQLDTGRKRFLSRCIDVRRDWANFRFNARRHGFATVNIQLDTGRKRFLIWCIDVACSRHLARYRRKTPESIVSESLVQVMRAAMVRTCQMA